MKQTNARRYFLSGVRSMPRLIGHQPESSKPLRDTARRPRGALPTMLTSSQIHSEQSGLVPGRPSEDVLGGLGRSRAVNSPWLARAFALRHAGTGSRAFLTGYRTFRNLDSAVNAEGAELSTCWRRHLPGPDPPALTPYALPRHTSLRAPHPPRKSRPPSRTP